jgi:hypothetical protein
MDCEERTADAGLPGLLFAQTSQVRRHCTVLLNDFHGTRVNEEKRELE